MTETSPEPTGETAVEPDPAAADDTGDGDELAGEEVDDDDLDDDGEDQGADG